ncbi:type II toxin-antitoxin system PemK/MazF family toxin [Agromyces sp. G08B096]|uniref:Type II toxin-antitoxin system PemK/MazF family toxin n=1 Tax=Agromyces sp. G08B096 TaxID=3156399 RepID=A0AAU7WDE5_9MICO
MPSTSRFLTALRRVVRSVSGSGRRPAPVRETAATRGGRAEVSARRVSAGELSPGQAGEAATLELDPHRIGRVRFAYAPEHDGQPDPGEIVWTWVPYEEHDGRGKDRPVAIVAAGAPGDFLAVQLTSKGRDGDRDYLGLGAGDWDASGRPSWARIDRVFRVRTGGMRREGASLDAERFARLTAALEARYGWR